MPEHVDRNGSKKAIDKKIAEEENAIDRLNKRVEKRKADGLAYDDLEDQIEDEKAKIAGKKQIKKVVDGFGQMESIDKEIEAEKSLLKDKKDEIARARGEEPKNRKKIDGLDEQIRRLEHCIAGKAIAKDAVIYD